MTSSSTEDLKVMVELIKEARANGIVELQYKDLKVRFSPAVQQGQGGPVTISPAYAQQAQRANWHTTLTIPQPKDE